MQPTPAAARTSALELDEDNLRLRRAALVSFRPFALPSIPAGEPGRPPRQSPRSRARPANNLRALERGSPRSDVWARRTRESAPWASGTPSRPLVARRDPEVYPDGPTETTRRGPLLGRHAARDGAWSPSSAPNARVNHRGGHPVRRRSPPRTAGEGMRLRGSRSDRRRGAGRRRAMVDPRGEFISFPTEAQRSPTRECDMLRSQRRDIYSRHHRATQTKLEHCFRSRSPTGGDRARARPAPALDFPVLGDRHTASACTPRIGPHWLSERSATPDVDPARTAGGAVYSELPHRSSKGRLRSHRRRRRRRTRRASREIGRTSRRSVR